MGWTCLEDLEDLGADDGLRRGGSHELQRQRHELQRQRLGERPDPLPLEQGTVLGTSVCDEKNKL